LREELLAEFGRHFMRLDRDSDGAISHSELLTVSQPRLAPLPRERQPRRPPMSR